MPAKRPARFPLLPARELKRVPAGSSRTKGGCFLPAASTPVHSQPGRKARLVASLKAEVDNLRELTRQKQQSLMAQYLSTPLAEWLAQWPATGGSAFERLQLALRRIPQALEQIRKEVETKGP